MITPMLLAAIAFLGPVSTANDADSLWDYTKEGSVSVSEEWAGRAGKFRTFHCTTDDATEKVTLWYAKRLGLPDKHSLVIAARKGFSSLGRESMIKTGYGHDTDKRKDHTTMLAVLSPQHAHITFLHRPDFAGRRDVSISITSIPGGKTSVVVMQPILDIFRQPAEKQGHNKAVNRSTHSRGN